MEKIKVVVVEPDKVPRVEEIENTTDACQALVGGYIEVVIDATMPSACIVLNEEGKLRGMPKNRLWGRDVLCGTFFVCGIGDDDFISLSSEQVEHYLYRFAVPDAHGAYDINDVISLLWEN